jgi:MtN3 and saliva related transmembrane protein
VVGYAEFGILGSLILAGAFFPQCYRILKTKSTKDISIYYPLVLMAGSFCLTVYGYGIHDLIVFTLNLYATLTNVDLLLLKLYYDRKATLMVATEIIK